MKRRWILILLVVVAALIGYQFVPSDPTEADLAAIRRVVAKRTSEAVLDVQSLPSGAVEVTTGWVKGPLNGDGETFKLRKFLGVWWVYSRSHWAA
jgi:hypothetical protein